jgi:hypothetical protein
MSLIPAPRWYLADICTEHLDSLRMEGLQVIRPTPMRLTE